MPSMSDSNGNTPVNQSLWLRGMSHAWSLGICFLSSKVEEAEKDEPWQCMVDGEEVWLMGKRYG